MAPACRNEVRPSKLNCLEKMRPRSLVMDRTPDEAKKQCAKLSQQAMHAWLVFPLNTRVSPFSQT